MTGDTTCIGLRGIGTALPNRFAPLAELSLVSAPETLAGFGFTGAHLADDPAALARIAAERALSNAAVEPKDIGALVFAGALPQAHHRASEGPAVSELDA